MTLQKRRRILGSTISATLLLATTTSVISYDIPGDINKIDEQGGDDSTTSISLSGTRRNRLVVHRDSQRRSFIMDPFHVIYKYDKYGSNYLKTYNRNRISTEVFLNHNPEFKFRILSCLI